MSPSAVSRLMENHVSPRPLSLKVRGRRTKDLDAVMPGRNKSPVQQAWEYAMDAGRWLVGYVVANVDEFAHLGCQTDAANNWLRVHSTHI